MQKNITYWKWFKVIKRFGNVSNEEMLRTFNLGIGLIIVAKKENIKYIKNHIEHNGINCTEIGQIIKGNKDVRTFGNFNW